MVLSEYKRPDFDSLPDKFKRIDEDRKIDRQSLKDFIEHMRLLSGRVQNMETKLHDLCGGVAPSTASVDSQNVTRLVEEHRSLKNQIDSFSRAVVEDMENIQRDLQRLLEAVFPLE